MIGWLRKSVPLWAVLVVAACVAGLFYAVGRWAGAATGLGALIYMTAQWAKASRERRAAQNKARNDHAKAQSDLTAEWMANRAKARSEAVAKAKKASASASAASDDANDLLEGL